MEEVLTAQEAAKVLGVKSAWIRQLIHQKRLRRAGYEVVNGHLQVNVYREDVELFEKNRLRNPYPRN